MLIRMVLAVSAALLLTASGFAMDCPAEPGPGNREAAVRKAPTCKAALEVMTACAYGASGDLALGQVVRERCEADFPKTMSKAQRAVYDQGIKRCNTKYRNEDGTMYRSFEAFCRAELAAKIAAKPGKAK